MDTCFFAFDTPLRALEAAFPKDSKALKHPRVLIKAGERAFVLPRTLLRVF